ncbi:MAG: cytochrome c biogenesis protein CcsA [Candidatus Hydrogenedentes bacterium]|nr:cytochrome c biogenesis protein CcsA [Candidatus Hydrogenedentota bacterium]
MNGKKTGLLVVAAAICVALSPAPVCAQEAAPSTDAPAPWSKDVLDTFSVIPIQEGGRIKPLDTYAGFQLLGSNGRRTCKTLDGESLTPMAWMLECLFFPERASQYKTFLIENPDVLSILGMQATKDRDRYSYGDLEPHRTTLFQMAAQFSGMPDKSRSPAQNQLINLAHNVSQFQQLTSYLHFARHPFPVGDNATLSALFGGKESVRLSDILSAAAALKAEYTRINTAVAQGSDAAAKADLERIQTLIKEMDSSVGESTALTLIPPAHPEDKEWLSVATLATSVFAFKADLGPQVEIVRALEGLVDHADDPAAFSQSATALNQSIVNLARERGEYDKVPMELTYYRADFFWNSLYLYILSFLLVAFLWMRPKSRVLNITTLIAVSIPTLLLVAGITMRCIIRARPPVTTLYETILFITAVAVVVALAIEFMYRQRIALSLAAFLGALGCFLANKYEVIEGTDTMPSMIAVLDTNFWLSTHVTTVTMGYAAGLLASAIAHVYIISYALGLRRKDPVFFRNLAGMTYGVLCFGLLFATVGTVLGGIWANYSWGRFWGWDPKENGALMIVLWMLIVLHARIARYIRDFGIVMGAVCCGMIVAFSWFGVNLLGVGLHSYGFTSGIAKALTTFYAIEVLVLLLGGIAWVWRPVPAETSGEETQDTTPRKKLASSRA